MTVLYSKTVRVSHGEQAVTEINSANNNPVTIIPEPETPVTIPETPETKAEAAETISETDPETDTLGRPLDLLPAVSGLSPDEVKSVIDAYLSGIAKRDICTHLKWDGNKYSTKGKPVIDAFLSQ